MWNRTSLRRRHNRADTVRSSRPRLEPGPPLAEVGTSARPEVEQVEDALGHLERHFAPVALGVAADLQRHLAIELDLHLVAVEVVHALRGRPARPQRAQVGEDGRYADRRQPQLALARRAGSPGDDLETEAVVGNGARRGDLARPAVDDLAALDVAAGRLAVGADPLRRPAEIDDFDVRRPVRHQVGGNRLADDRAEITEPARADLVLHADVVVEQLGVDAET